MRIAVISDVHGNLVALDAVLADIEAQRVDATLALGDFLSGPFDPTGTADRLMALDFPRGAGSVGLPLALGMPDARYAVIEKREGDWAVDLKSIPYGLGKAAEQARIAGFESWAVAVTTGWSTPRDL